MFNNKALDAKRGIKLPKNHSKELAEFFGILAGDGYISFEKDRTQEIKISGHSIDDKDYHVNYICPLIKKLFGLLPKIRTVQGQKTRVVYIRSVSINRFIRGTGYYKRNGKIKLPQWIFKEAYFYEFLRGLFDTDGSVAVKKKYRIKPYYPVLGITLKNKELISYIAYYLKKHGFKLWWGALNDFDTRTNKYYLRYRVQLSGFKQLALWREKISFSNPKHLAKYDYVIKKKFGQKGI